MLSIIVPVFNESGNVGELHRRISSCMNSADWELVFVDDNSTDGTTSEIKAICQQDPRVRMLLRVGRRGLSSACIEGILSTTTDFFAVIDGDLQHDETKLPEMLRLLTDEDKDLAIGSRYVAGGNVGDWSGSRIRMSRLATFLSRAVMRQSLTDPMSGFFAMRRSAFDACLSRLSQQGFKILLDICSSSPVPLRIAEVPYSFGVRKRGDSKLDALVILEYLVLLINKSIGATIPLRFVLFSLVGTLGLVLHLLVLRIGLGAGATFGVAQGTAVMAAMTFNYFLNNRFTYRDRRLSGAALLLGLLSFYIICSIGAVANVGVGSYVYSRGNSWGISGLAGALVGVVWNYVVTATFTWSGRRRAR